MKTKGLTLTELLVVIGATTMVTGSLMPALHGSRQTAVRLVCETNLTGIGKAMVAYAAENEVGDYPVAGGLGAGWSPTGNIPNWGGSGCDEQQAFGYDHSIVPPLRGTATITSSFFLLVKHVKVRPKQFVCKGDGAQEFRLSDQNRVRITDIALAWDFGDGDNDHAIYPGGYCSYSYQMPYSVRPLDPLDVTNFAVTDRTNPAMPVCADRNPYLDGKIDPGDPLWNGNSAAHERKGQNVLYKDGSVTFEDNADIGLSDDNIWKYGAGTPPTTDTTGVLGEAPVGEKDSFLVNEMN